MFREKSIKKVDDRKNLQNWKKNVKSCLNWNIIRFYAFKKIWTNPEVAKMVFILSESALIK